jgi:hypothetical protein
MKKIWIELLIMFLTGVLLGTGLYGIIVGPECIWWASFWTIVCINFWATEAIFRNDSEDNDDK